MKFDLEESPELWCTVIDASNWYHATFFAMAQVVLFKIILILSPATFLVINTQKTKQLCWLQIVLSFVYIIVHITVYGHKCTGKVFTTFVEEIWSLEIDNFEIKKNNFTNFALGKTILFIVLIVELVLKVYVTIKRKLLNKKSSVNVKSSSYNYMLFLLFFIFLQVITYLCLDRSNNKLTKSFFSMILKVIHRVSVHIYPIFWIIYHDSIQTYACHKINQVKINQFSYIFKFLNHIKKNSFIKFNSINNIS